MTPEQIAQAVPGVQPGRQLDHAQIRRHRPRARDQPPALPADGRRHRGRERAGRRQHLHRPAARAGRSRRPSPAAAASAEPATGPQRSGASGNACWSSTTRQTVRDLMRRFLAREGFEVVTAADGAEGLAARPRAPAGADHPRRADAGPRRLERAAGAQGAIPSFADIPVVMLTIVDEKNQGYALGAADLSDQAGRPRAAARRLLAALPRPTGEPRVLIVEDDADTRGWLARMLREEAGRWPRPRTAAWPWTALAGRARHRCCST